MQMIRKLEARAEGREEADPGKGKELAGAEHRMVEKDRRVEDSHRVKDRRRVECHRVEDLHRVKGPRGSRVADNFS